SLAKMRAAAPATASSGARLRRGAGSCALVLAVIAAGADAAAASVQRDPGFVFVSSTPTDRSSWAHSVPAGADRYVVVAVTIGPTSATTPTVASLRFAGTAMSFLGAAMSITRVRTELWGLTAPPVGSQAVELRLTGSGAVVAGSVSFSGV